MLDTKNKKKLSQKRNFIISRLKELRKFPHNLSEMNEEQYKNYEDICNNNFEYWEKIKIENGWSPNKKSLEEKALAKKRTHIRSYFRENNILPPYGDPLNDEQEKIISDIENNNFNFYHEFVAQKTPKIITKTIKETKDPKINYMLKQQQPKNSMPKYVLHRLRMCQILPPLNEPLNEQQQLIFDDVHENWMDKEKSFFILKYIHLSTPEGRILYRTYKKYQEEGFNFNLTIDDIVIPEYCPLLNVKILTDPKDKDQPNYYSIDRIDNSKGYVKGNVQIISKKANIMKNQATINELVSFANNYLNLLNNVH